MTKSQNTKSEQLTEQWKKGELPYAEYYIKLAGGEYTNDVWDVGGWQSFNKKGDVVVEVLAKVPPYEVYKDLIDGRKLLREYIKDTTNENSRLKEYERIVTSYNMKPIDYDIACETVIKLLDDNKRLKHDVGNLGYKIKNQRHEIDNRLKEIWRLKELLKECKEPLEVFADKKDACEWCPEDLLAKIDEVLK